MTSSESPKTIWSGFAAVAFVTVAAAELLVGMEWLFHVTHPSFLSALDALHRVALLVVTPVPLAWAAAGLALLAWLAVRPSARGGDTKVRHVVVQIPAVLLVASLLLLMVDNFTTTLWGVGVLKASGAWRWAYVPVVLACLLGAGFLVGRWTRAALRLPQRSLKTAVVLLLVVPLVASALWGLGPARAQRDAAMPFAELGAAQRRPNILLLSADGVDATHLSVYGYERPTTPTLDRLASRSLLCENAFANCGNTPGSLMSLLTGRNTAETRVVFPPDILSGADVERHLPGILRSLGYRSLHISIRYYADAWDMNLQGGFDVSTFRRRPPPVLRRTLGDDVAYFFDHTLARVRDRVGHVFGAGAPTAVAEVQLRSDDTPVTHDPRAVDSADPERMQALLDFMRDGEAPFFAHVHLMATHGPLFHLEEQVFSRGQRQTQPWRTDFYDDAILEFDRRIAEVFTALEENGQADNTIVVVHSDHGSGWDALKRTPLLFFFPHGEHAGRLSTNVQNLDIAPTLLDHLGLRVPEWMSGVSLLGEPPDPRRPVFGSEYDDTALVDDNGRLVIAADRIEAPFYTMRRATMVVCDRVFRVDLQSRDLRFGRVEGHTRPCADGAVPSARKAFVTILEYLSANGYDVSSFGVPDTLDEGADHWPSR